MKKLTFSLLITLFSYTVFAQNISQHIGITYSFSEAALREAPLNYYLNGKKEASPKLSTVTHYDGTKIGLVYELDFYKGLGFQLGLNYQYGTSLGKWKENDAAALQSKVKTKTNISLHTLDIPLDLQYKFQIAKQTYLIVYSGPTFQYNFGILSKTFKRQYELNPTSKTWSWGKIQTETDNAHYLLDNDHDGITDYSHLNLTWGVGLGFQYKQYFLRGGYDFGISSPYKDQYYNHGDNTLAFRGRFDQWQIRLGIFLWNK